MTHTTQSMIQVLEWRERKSHRALARVTRAIASVVAQIRVLEEIIAAVDAQVTTNRIASLTGVPVSVAKLLERERHTQTLISAREGVADRKRQSEHKLAELRIQQRIDAREWRRDEVKLMHARTLVRREMILQAARHAEAQEQAS